MTLHVYGVVGPTTPLPRDLRGRQKGPVRLIVHGDLAAVVSEIDANARDRRDDLLAHARVLEALIESSTVLPMRYGVIVETENAVVHEILEAGESGLTALLDSFEGLVQLTVKAYHDQDEALKHLLRERPDIRELRNRSAAGSAYHSQLRLGEATAVGLDELAHADAAMLYDQITGLAEQIVLGDATGRSQVLDAALLVKREGRTITDEGIARLSTTLPKRLRLRYIGPQPPYSFVGSDLAGEPVWV